MAHISSEIVCASIDSELCVACGSCEAACPLSIIAINDGHAECVDPESCVLCGSCVSVCSNGAITVD